ncbi:hypothetical protein [Virgisporangium ochraceum]|nr:hypothetical protein [Virgisporangium ochraceum]
MERFLADLRTPDGPLSRFVFMGAQATSAEVHISYRCWPENRFTEIRAAIAHIANSHGPATVSFPNDPFPAMVVPEREGLAMARFLGNRAPVTTLRAGGTFQRRGPRPEPKSIPHTRITPRSLPTNGQ